MPCDSPVASLNDLLDQAFAELAAGNFENAIDGFSEYLLIESKEAKAYEGRAHAYFQIKKWREAISDFRKASELNSENPGNWAGLGMSLAMVNEIYEAIDVFETLLARTPHYARGHFQLGSLYYRLGVIKKGHEQMDLALASRPSLEERRMIEQLKKEQLTLDKRRYYKPDFEALKRSNKGGEGWIKTIASFLKNKLQNKRG